MEFFTNFLSYLVIALLGVPLLTLLFSYLQTDRRKQEGKMTEQSFIITIPKGYTPIFALCAIVCVVFVVVPFFQGEKPNPVILLFVVPFFWLCIYTVIRVLCTKIVVEGDQLTVSRALRKTFTCTFADLASAKREVKYARVPMERVVVRTKDGKKFIAENSYAGYPFLRQRLKEELPREALEGFIFDADRDEN